MHMDQAILNEVVPSVLWGRPVFLISLEACQDKSDPKRIEVSRVMARMYCMPYTPTDT